MKIKSLVFIDDDPASNYIHNLVLKKLNLGIDPKFFLGVKEALVYLSNRQNSEKAGLEIIFSDINMPVNDGWDFVKDFTDNLYKPGNMQFIVMFTSSIAPDDIKKADKYEAVFDLVEKPLSVKLLTELFDGLLKVKKG